jgi:two-component system, sporulation sensor kinase A
MDAPHTRVRSFAFWQGDEFGEEFEYDLQGTPCERIVGSNSYQCFPTQLQVLFPKDRDLVDMSAQSYAGIPLLTSTGELLSQILLYSRPQTLDRSQIELNGLIAETLNTLQTNPVKY